MRSSQFTFLTSALLAAGFIIFSGCANPAGPPAGNQVEGISLDTSTLELFEYKTSELSAATVPSDAEEAAVTWSSNKPEVASVDSSGKVTALSDGTATITATTVEDGFSDSCTVIVNGAGNVETLEVNGFTLPMVLVPGGITFPRGIDDNGDDGMSSSPEYTVGPTSTVAKAYRIMDTEVPYDLWYEVREWAENTASPSYTFANKGLQEWFGSSAGDPPENENRHRPVCDIGYRDALVWCNALTEYYNAHNGSSPDLDCVYYTDGTYDTPLRAVNNDAYSTSPKPAAGSQDNPYIKAEVQNNTDITLCSAEGFRLPTNIEWECAARYIDDVDNNAVLETGEYYPGNYASGASGPYTDTAASGEVAWYSDSWGGIDQPWTVGTAGGDPLNDPLKSGNANALGLYDMSGNIREITYGWQPGLAGDGNYHITIRGGYASGTGEYLQIGRIGSYINAPHNFNGLRIARSAK